MCRCRVRVRSTLWRIRSSPSWCNASASISSPKARWTEAGRHVVWTAKSKNKGASDMTTQRLGVIMNGVTGRMGLNQHLIRSIVAIRDSGGVLLGNGDRMMPDPILVGRDAGKLEGLAKRFNVTRWTTDLDKAVAGR